MSPLQRIAQAVELESEIETVKAYPVPLWEKGINITVKMDYQEATQTASDIQGIVIATCMSERNKIIGIGGVICDTTTTGSMNTSPATDYSIMLGPRDQLNLYVAELIAIKIALQNLAVLQLLIGQLLFSQATYLRYKHSIVLSTNQDNRTSTTSTTQPESSWRRATKLTLTGCQHKEI